MEISQRETLIYECYIPFLTTFKTSPVHSELVRSSHFNQPANKLPKKKFKLESQLNYCQVLGYCCRIMDI